MSIRPSAAIQGTSLAPVHSNVPGKRVATAAKILWIITETFHMLNSGRRTHMPQPDNFGAFELGELLAGMVHGLPAAQRRLDNDYLSRLLAFAPVFQEAAAAGAAGLASAILPSAMAIDHCEMTLAMAAEASASSGMSVSFRLLNAGYLRRYRYTKTARHEVRLTVRRAPPAPGARVSVSP